MGVKGRVKGLGVWWMVSLLSVASLAAVSSDRRLVDAVQNRDQEALHSLLKEHVDVNAAQADGTTALAWAAHWDDLEMADLLIRAGANVNSANDYGVTPLWLACRKGNAAMVEKLLKAKANPNTALWAGETPLMTCARTGNVEAVKSLLAHGADGKAETRRGQTALMWAAAEKHLDIVRTLIEHGADVNAKSHRLGGFTPPQYITYAWKQHVPGKIDDDVVASLTHLDPASSRGGFTPLMFAAQQGDLDSARILLAAGANVNETSPYHGSALVMASASGHEELAIFLLDKGADPSALDEYGITALHYALGDGITAIAMNRPIVPSDHPWLRPNMPELVKALLARGANPNARIGLGLPPFDIPAFGRTTGNDTAQLRQPGMTAFLLAAASHDVSLMRLLVASGADPLLATEEGTTPLMVAAGVGLEDNTKKSEAPEEDASATDEEKNALEAVRLAVELGGDVNAANMSGRTALQGAALLGWNSIIQFLADRGAKLDSKDMYGLTALIFAEGNPERLGDGGNELVIPIDNRFPPIRARKSSADLLLKLGATPRATPAAKDSGPMSAEPIQ